MTTHLEKPEKSPNSKVITEKSGKMKKGKIGKNNS